MADMSDTEKARRSAALAWPGTPADARKVRSLSDDKLHEFIRAKIAAAFLSGTRRGRTTTKAVTSAQRIREYLAASPKGVARTDEIAARCKLRPKDVSAHLAVMRSRSIVTSKLVGGVTAWSLSPKGKRM